MADRKGRLIIICGLPGSGKTTLAAALVEQLGAVLFASDDWMIALHLDMWSGDARARVEALQWQQAQAILKLGGTAIIEWGSWGRSERDTLRLGARALGAAVELAYLTAPLETLYARVAARGREDPPITLEMLTGWSRQFQAPTAEELALYDPPATPVSP
jgi:predicted kinase